LTAASQADDNLLNMTGESSVGLTVDVRSSRSAGVEDAPPFRIAVFGDFSGRASRGLCDSAAALSAPARPVDRDDFDEVLAQMAPEIRTPLGNIRFRELEDFHPDRLFASLPVFQELRTLRARLSNPKTFREAAAELAGAPAPERPRPKSGSLLADMLEEAEPGGPAAPARPAESYDDLHDYIRTIVAPYLVPGKDPRQDELVGQVDAAIAGRMRALLHHPDFQALEAAWRTVFLMVRRLDTGPDLKLFLYDVSGEELSRDLAGASDLRSTGFYKKMVSAEPWAVAAGNYTFTSSLEDVDLLARIAMVSHQAGAPFLAAASNGVLGCASLAAAPDPYDWTGRDAGADEIWQTLRQFPEAAYLGLALPRLLLRLPYGKGASETEQFAFEEMAGAPVHEEFLWGNAGLACACLLGETFARDGWNMRPGVIREIGGLPYYTYKEDGVCVSKPCAEALLTDRAAEAIQDRGLMALLSAKDGDRVLVAGFRSVADPPSALAGRWCVNPG
jgi:type VI secretion system protein ImpC